MSQETKKDTNEIKAAEHFARKGTPSQDVLKWLHQVHYGVLSTLNVKEKSLGYPLGSIVPFALDAQGKPFIFIANIAAHTHNLIKNNKASLFVYNNHVDGDPQKTWRTSIIGNFKKLVSHQEESQKDYCEYVAEEELNELMARYIERVPKAKGYAQMHGFHFWRVNDIKTIRYIAGFGRICWVSGSEYLENINREYLENMRKGALIHMNEDHKNNMLEICRAFYNITETEILMHSLDNHGCLFISKPSNKMYFVSFNNVVEKPADFKKEIIALLGRARKLLSTKE